MSESIVEIRVDQGYQLIMLQDDQWFGNIRHVVQLAFNFFGIDILSAGGEEQVFATSANGYIPFFVYSAEITCMQPAIYVNDLRSSFLIFIIAQHKIGSFTDDFSCMSLRVRRIDFYFHSRRRFPARSKFQVFPAAGANDRTTFCHTVSDGVGETYFLEEGFYFSIERSAADNDFIKITAEYLHSSLSCQRFDLIVYDGYFKQ